MAMVVVVFDFAYGFGNCGGGDGGLVAMVVVWCLIFSVALFFLCSGLRLP